MHFFRGGGGPTCNEYLSSGKNFKFGGITVLAVQLFKRIKQKKNLKKTCFSVFPTCFVKINLSLVKCYFLYVLDIYVYK